VLSVIGDDDVGVELKEMLEAIGAKSYLVEQKGRNIY
jgi:bifunctional ADP-heptose synthase (sugar kinase/adenylyltransferase)